MTISELIRSIQGTDEKAMEESRRHWDSLAKPLQSLGELENCIVRIAGVSGSPEVKLDKRTLLVLCADNGVVAQGVSQSDESVTTAVASALGEGTSTVNYMAEGLQCEVIPVNIGMKEAAAKKTGKTSGGVLELCLQQGTGDITEGPAMTRTTCEKAILLGADLVRKEKEKGTDVILIGEMGIGNTTTTAAAASVLLQRDPEVMTGRGAGLSDEALLRKQSAVKKAIRVNRPDPSDPIDILCKVGGLDLAGLCGICLGGAYYGIPVILDGVITNTAALCAVRLNPNVKKALTASHVSAEPAARLVLEELGLQPLICAGLHLGEGSGAVLALPLLDTALKVYRSGHTFGHLGIEAYTPQ